MLYYNRGRVLEDAISAWRYECADWMAYSFRFRSRADAIKFHKDVAIMWGTHPVVE